MAGDPLRSADRLLELNFQSLAAQELSMKQMELDSATAKLDALRRDLEQSRAESLEVFSYQNSTPSLSPSLARRPQSSQPSSSLGQISSQPPHRFRESTLSVPYTPTLAMTSTPTVPTLSLSSSPNLPRRSLPSDTADPYVSAPSRAAWGRPSSPRPQYYERPVSSPSSTTRLSSSSYDYVVGPKSASSVHEGTAMVKYTEWGPPQRPPSAYEAPSAFMQPRFSDDVSSLRRRPPHRSWNESDLDMMYDKKTTQDRSERASLGGVPVVKAWRETSLDPAPVKGKGDVSSTLPRGYKFSSMDRSSHGPDTAWKNSTGTLPRYLPSQQPISRIPVPPAIGRGQPHRPLPLSMIFHLQNAFWEHQVPPQTSTMPSASTNVTPLPVPNVSIPVTPDINAATAIATPASEEVPRPLSPTRLQPQLPPSLADVQRVLEDIPRPLRRRGSQEHTMQTPPLPTHRRQYRQIMSRLFGRATPKSSPLEQIKAEEKLQGSAGRVTSFSEASGEEENLKMMNPIPEEPRTEEKPEMSPWKPGDDAICVILESSESRVGATIGLFQPELDLSVPVVVSGSQQIELRSALKGRSSPRKPRHARLDPLVLLLDGALTGEVDVVTQALREVHDPSQPNEEGITALHNAICGANLHIVNLLINSGANVNATDSHGWTPLHCAASCNDLQICSILVRHGAAIFTTTYSDGSLPVDKCDPYREGYKECLTYLTEVEECMGETQSGVVYALWDYCAEFADELSLHEGDSVTVLRKDGEGGQWWWAALCGREGYVPRNYFGVYPRLRPQRSPV